jgi:acyl carrier protein
MTEAEIYAELAVVFEDVFFRDDIELTPETSAKGVEGWDSMRQIEILMGIEERMGIKFNTKEIDGLKNVGDLVAVIQRKRP